jgi:hypothetical protein
LHGDALCSGGAIACFLELSGGDWNSRVLFWLMSLSPKRAYRMRALLIGDRIPPTQLDGLKNAGKSENPALPRGAPAENSPEISLGLAGMGCSGVQLTSASAPSNTYRAGENTKLRAKNQSTTVTSARCRRRCSVRLAYWLRSLTEAGVWSRPSCAL